MKMNMNKIANLMVINTMLGANLTLEESKLMSRILSGDQKKN